MLLTVSVENTVNHKTRSYQVAPPASGSLLYPSTPEYLEKIEGLGPMEQSVNLVTTSVGGYSSYTGGFTEKRNIVMYIQLAPDGPVSPRNLAEGLYNVFGFGIPIRMTFNVDNFSAPYSATAYVEEIEYEPFAETHYFVVSLLCPDPYFTCIYNTALDSAPNKSFTIRVTEDTDLFINSWNFVPDSDTTNLYFYIETEYYGREKFEFSLFSPSGTVFRAGASFILNTIPGQRSFYRNTNPITPYEKYIRNDSIWPVLHPGLNTVGVEYAEGSVRKNRVQWNSRVGNLL